MWFSPLSFLQSPAIFNITDRVLYGAISNPSNLSQQISIKKQISVQIKKHTEISVSQFKIIYIQAKFLNPRPIIIVISLLFRGFRALVLNQTQYSQQIHYTVLKRIL
jgi:hypothetical protein